MPSALCLQVDYSKSLELEPDNVKTLNNRGYSYAKSGQYAAAVVRCKQRGASGS